MAAFANTDGGKLLIGVDDDGTISGINSQEELYMIEKASNMYCIPKVDFTSRKWNVSGKKVLEINIVSSNTPPHKAPDSNGKYMAYVRIDDENILASSLQMKIWKKQTASENISFSYSHEAKELLDLIKNNQGISLKELITAMQISKYSTENILAELIIMKIIKMETTTDKINFSLADPEI